MYDIWVEIVANFYVTKSINHIFYKCSFMKQVVKEGFGTLEDLLIKVEYNTNLKCFTEKIKVISTNLPCWRLY